MINHIYSLLETEKEILVNNPVYEINSEYNVFNVLDIQRKEVIMCRFLADLLNPHGQHGQGSIFLKDFFERILGISEQDEKIYESTQVITEYPIDSQDGNSKRRIDIVISNAKHFIPIEVKIYADEQENQCLDYYNYAKDKDANTRLVYLTRFSTEPSMYSRGDIDIAKVRTIGWSHDIVPWIEDSMRQINDEKLNYILGQYIDAIYQIANERDRNIMNESIELILNSAENLRAAVSLEESMNNAKLQLIKLLFEEFENQMEEVCKRYPCLGKEKTSKYLYYQNEENDNFYNGQTSTYPGISYVVSSPKGKIFSNDNLELWFRIEIECNLYAGFSVFDRTPKDRYSYGSEVPCPDDEIRKEASAFLHQENFDSNSWWLMWCYSNGNQCEESCVPNFKKMNEAAIKLIDEQARQNFVRETIKCFDEKLLKLLN